MKRPRIGVTMQRNTPQSEMSVHPGYTESVYQAGGAPLILPLLSDDSGYAEVLDMFDGFLLTGSEADVSPELYSVNCEANHLGRTPPENNFSDPLRDAQDFAILRHAEATQKPVFGICRGCQVMNVYRGGTLALHYSEINPTEPVRHDHPDRSGPPVHTIIFTQESQLRNIAPAETALVNSLHRQVCERLGEDLLVAAWSEDRLVEAIEDTRFPERFFAVQWHPERSTIDPAPLSQALFRRFLQACQNRSKVYA